MRSAPQAVIDYLATHAACWQAELYTITLRAPVHATQARVLRYTTHEQSFVFTDTDAQLLVGSSDLSGGYALRTFAPIEGHGDGPDGDEVYRTPGAAYPTTDESYPAPILTRGPLSQVSGLVVDTLDITIEGAVHYADPLTGKDQSFALHAIEGLFDGATVRIDKIVGAYPGDLSLGIIDHWWDGVVGEVTPASLGVRLACKSTLSQLAVKMLPKIRLQTSCPLALYSPECGVDIDDVAVETTVDTCDANKLVAVDSISDGLDVNRYEGGAVIWLDGPLEGQISGVIRSGTPGLKDVYFARALTTIPPPGTAVRLIPGCPKTRAACLDRYDNLANYRGYPHKPTAGTGGLR